MNYRVKNEQGGWVDDIPVHGQPYQYGNGFGGWITVAACDAGPSTADEARAWKNAELARTQDIMAVPDYRYHPEMAAYRQQLMDWTDSDYFPDVRPVMPLTPKGFPIY